MKFSQPNTGLRTDLLNPQHPKNQKDQYMKNTRFILSGSSLWAAVVLTRLSRWLLPSSQFAPAVPVVPTAAAMNSTPADSKAPPSPRNNERRVRLDIPFVAEADTEFHVSDASGPAKDKVNPAWPARSVPSDYLKFRSDAGNRRARNFLAASASLILAFCATIAPTRCASAATLTWTGNSFLTANWSDTGNWDVDAFPHNGDTLIFPSTLAQANVTNDIVGLTLNQLQFLGDGPTIVLAGNTFTLTNGILVNYSFGGIYINNNITLAGTDNVIDVEKPGGQVGYLYLLGNVGGSVGVTKTGQGALIYQAAGNNTYTGTTRVNNGWLELNVSGAHAFEGSLIIGDNSGTNSPMVALLQGIEISQAPVTINLNGTLNLNGFSDTLNNLTLQGGSVQSGAGTLTMLGNLNVLSSTATASIGGNLRFNGGLQIVNVAGGSSAYPDLNLLANISDSGGGLLFTNTMDSAPAVEIYGSNTFTGPLIVNNLTLAAQASSALGAASSAATVGSNGRLWIYASGITNHSVTLADGATLVGQAAATWAGPIVLNGNVKMDSFGASSLFELVGPISGPGGFTKIDDGTLRLSGTNANAYGGTTLVTRGILELNKTDPSGTAVAIPGSLVLTNGATTRLLQSWQIYSPYRSTNLTVTLRAASLLDLAGSDDWIGPLTMEAAQITTGAGGMLYLTGDMTVVTNAWGNSVISGNLQFYGYSNTTSTTISNTGHYYSPDLALNANLSSGLYFNTLIAAGSGEIELGGINNTFSAPLVVNGGDVWVEYSNSLGNTNEPAIVNPGGELLLENNVSVGLKPLSLNGNGSSVGALTSFGTNTWAGDIYLAGDATITPYFSSNQITLSGAITGPGGFTKAGVGTLILSGSTSNTFSGATIVKQGILTLTKTNAMAIPGPVTIGAGLDGPNGDILRALQPNQLAWTSPVTICSSGLFDVSLSSITRAGSISGLGSVQMGTSTIMMGFDNSSNTFGGSLSGSGDLTKVGTGTFTYTGTGSYGGQFGINSGQVFVDGSLASAAIFFYAGTTLGGHGSVGPVTSGAGLLTPGDNNPGNLNSGSMTLASGNTLLAYLTGTNTSGYSQLSFSGGTIALGGAHLQLNMSGVGVTNAHYTLIHNPTLHVISGTFSGLPEGATVLANNGVPFTISYHGGYGNEVVLTQTALPAPTVITSIARATNGVVSLHGTGAPNVTYHVQANTNLTTTNWINLGPVIADGVGALLFNDSQAGTYAQRFYRFVYP
jgi:autotransporter-associated beta strand protein